MHRRRQSAEMSIRMFRTRVNSAGTRREFAGHRNCLPVACRLRISNPLPGTAPQGACLDLFPPGSCRQNLKRAHKVSVPSEFISVQKSGTSTRVEGPRRRKKGKTPPLQWRGPTWQHQARNGSQFSRFGRVQSAAPLPAAASSSGRRSAGRKTPRARKR